MTQSSTKIRPASASNRWAWGALMVLVMLPAVVPALTRDIGARAYDAATEHVLRGVVFSNAISEGVLYPRWVQNLHIGLGSPLFTFQPPLPYYGMDVLSRLGLSHPIGWRVLIAAALVAAFVGMYLLVRDLTGRKWPALVAATAYLYAPYVLRNTLERGSNEAFSMALYPLVLWSLLWTARKPGPGRFIAATLIWAACIASHVLGPLMLFPVALAFAGLLAWRHRTFAPIGVLLVGGLLTAFIWAPMIPEQAWVHVERDFTQPESIPADNPIRLDALLALPPIYDVGRDNNGGGDRVGLAQTAVLVVGLIAAAYAWRRNRRLAWALIAFSALGLILFWLFTAASDPVWRAGAPVLGRLLYRTRLMGLQALAAAGTAGLIVAILPASRQRAVSLALIAIFALSAFSILYVELQHRWVVYDLPVDLAQARAGEVRMGGSALTAFGEFTPRWRDDPFDAAFMAAHGTDFDSERTPLAEPEAGAIGVGASTVRDGAWDVTVQAAEAMTATLNLLYYPRWAASLDGQPVTLHPQPNSGLAQLALPAGEHVIALRYTRTRAEWVGFAVSGLTLAVLAALGVWALSTRRRAFSIPDAPAQPVMAEANAPLWLLGGLAALLLVKFLFVDSSTTLLRCVSTPQRVCGATATLDAPFRGGHRLRGYTVSPGALHPGESLRVDLYWQAEAGVEGALQSFVHVRNSQKDWPMNPQTENELWAQDEHVAPGGFPTTQYAPGKLYADSFRVQLPADMPPGEYYLEVGWFDPLTGEQLDPVAEAIQPPLRILWRSLLLPNIEVRP